MVRIGSLLMLFGAAIASVAAQQCGTQNSNRVCAAGQCCSQYGWLVPHPRHVIRVPFVLLGKLLLLGIRLIYASYPVNYLPIF